MRSAIPCRVAATFAIAAAILAAQTTDGKSQVFTRATDIRALTAEQAKQGFPVHIRGVITDDVPSPDYFVQDDSAGIYVEGNKAFQHRLGDLVEVDGVTAPGRFAPVIHESSVHVIGPGELPEAKPYAFRDFASGQLDSQWMQVHGVVRRVWLDHASWHQLILALELASGGGQFLVRVPLPHERDMTDWIGRELSVRGVCGSLFNAQRQLVAILFYVPRLSFIQAAPLPPEVPINDLLRFSPYNRTRPRVRVRGVVAYQQLGRVVFIEGGDFGLRVFTDQTTQLQPGDVIDVSGVPAIGDSAPVLQEASFRSVNKSAPPFPRPFVFKPPLERFDASLVRVQATLLNAGPEQLVLQQAGNVFSATFDSDFGHQFMNVAPGTLLEITGICLVRRGGMWLAPESIQLLLRRPGDVRILRSPPWWTASALIWFLLAALGLLAAVLVWNFVLKKKLREQRDIVRQKLRSSTILEERNRIARELHDTLEQHLAGITMQLDLAAHCMRDAPNLAERAVDQARNMTRHSLLEARQSVWDLRCHLLENGDLSTALAETIKQWPGNEGPKIKLKVSGTPLRLPQRVEAHLLRIGQEAVTNALKHAHAEHVTVHVKYGPKTTRLEVDDDGYGFEPASAKPAMDGHFGLLDMRERAQSLGCDLRLTSVLGRGTHVEVEVPSQA